MQKPQFAASGLYHYRSLDLWPSLFCSTFILFSVLTVVYLGQQVSAQETGTSNPSIINSPPPQNSPPSFNSPPSQNAPPSSDPQTSASQAKYPLLQISSPLILALVIAAIAAIGGTLYVISRRYVMAE
jgi:hypothetical protein